ncbi:hypothetical protein ACWEOA_11520 [Streptomyces sp. NPDC004457]
MNTRITAVVLVAASALALTACSTSSESGTRTAPSPKASKTPSPERSAAERTGGIPPTPTGAKREALLRALAAANPDIVKYEDKAIEAARNQCGAISQEAQRMDWAASQRFTYKDVTTTETQGKQINEALRGLGFCKV